MKLYMHPASTTSRTVLLYVAENKIPVEEQVVDIFTGEHMKPPYSLMNPNKMVPMLEDGDFRLTESSTILKYLAEKTNSPTYPKDLKQRARVNEIMDWFNSNFYRDWGYGLIYPQVFPGHKRQTAEAQAKTIEWGKKNSETWLKVLNDFFIGPKKQYLCGDQITVADYFGIGVMTVGEVIHCGYSAYPNIERWVSNMKKLKSWPKVYEVFNGFVNSVKDQQFVAI